MIDDGAKSQEAILPDISLVAGGERRGSMRGGQVTSAAEHFVGTLAQWLFTACAVRFSR